MAKEEEGLDPIEGVTAEMLQSAFKKMDMDLNNKEDVQRFATHFEKQVSQVTDEARRLTAEELQRNLNAALKPQHDSDVAEARKGNQNMGLVWGYYQAHGYEQTPHPEWVDLQNPEHIELYKKHKAALFAEALNRTVKDVNARVYGDWQNQLREQKEAELAKVPRGLGVAVVKIQQKYRDLGLREDAPGDMTNMIRELTPDNHNRLLKEYRDELAKVPRGQRSMMSALKRKYRLAGLNDWDLQDK